MTADYCRSAVLPQRCFISFANDPVEYVRASLFLTTSRDETRVSHVWQVSEMKFIFTPEDACVMSAGNFASRPEVSG